MKYLTNKNGFLGIDNKFNFKEKVVIVPFGLEKTVSYGGGTKNGPKEIINDDGGYLFQSNNNNSLVKTIVLFLKDIKENKLSKKIKLKKRIKNIFLKDNPKDI